MNQLQRQSPTDIFHQLWNSQEINEVFTSTNPSQFQVEEFDENALFNREIHLQVDEFEISNLPAVPQPPHTLTYPSVDSGIQASDIFSEMTTSPDTISVQSPLPDQEPQHGAASQKIPSNKVWPGEYEFELNVETCGDNCEKSISWTYSSILNKLYVDREKNSPINFRTSVRPPEGTILRVLPIFQKVGSMPEVVKICPHHVGPEGDPSANHIVICQDPATVYETDENTGRHSLTLPYTEPQAGNSYVQHLLMFKCFISCVGGLNRRPIQLIFSLEHRGEVIGRQVLDVRVCACPGRDRKSDEKNNGKPKKGTKRTKQITQTVEITSLRNKKAKNEHKEVFCIRVDSREKYEILMKLKEALDLMEHVTDEQKETYRNKEAQLNEIPVPALLTSLSGSSSSGFTVNQPTAAYTQPTTSLPQPIHHPNLLTATAAINRHQPVMMQQPSRNLHSCLGQPVTDNGNLSDLLGRSILAATSQQFDAALPPMSSDQSYTQLNTLPSLTRADTLPILSNLSFLAVDQPDGPRSMEQVSSSQAQRTASVSGMVTPSVQGSQVTSSMDKSINVWLERRGFGKYICVFQEKGLQTVENLDDIQIEFFNETTIPHEDREAIWKSILEYRTSLSFKCTPPLERVRSNASTCSNHSQIMNSQGQVVKATRYTLRQTLSFKVEKTDEDEI